jgi:hypothetical protein
VRPRPRPDRSGDGIRRERRPRSYGGRCAGRGTRGRRTTELAWLRIVTGVARTSKNAADVAMVGVAVATDADFSRRNTIHEAAVFR